MTASAGVAPTSGPLLEVTDLVKRFPVAGGMLTAVDGVSFRINTGETLGLVGESGSGKSTTGMSVLQLPAPTSGSVRFEGTEMVGARRSRLRAIRRRMQVVLQDPVAALNPRRNVATLVAEGLRWNPPAKGEDSQDLVDQALREVGFEPSEVRHRRPSEFSGGQCQRIAIARAMVLRPGLLVCDEPVASLDVSIQGQVINLLEDMREEHGLGMLFISHDLSVVRSISDRVAVMYLGQIVEIGDTDEIFARPQHPYTQLLLLAVPEVDSPGQDDVIRIRGDVPSPINPPSGCRFRTRCPLAQPICAEFAPPLQRHANGSEAACHFAGTRVETGSPGVEAEGTGRS